MDGAQYVQRNLHSCMRGVACAWAQGVEQCVVISAAACTNATLTVVCIHCKTSDEDNKAKDQRILLEEWVEPLSSPDMRRVVALWGEPSRRAISHSDCRDDSCTSVESKGVVSKEKVESVQRPQV